MKDRAKRKVAAAASSPVVAAATVTIPQPKTLNFVDSSYLYRKPPGWGIGAQNGPILQYGSGDVRDYDTLKLVSRRPMLEPKIDWEVLAMALKAIPEGGWAILDVEGVTRFQTIDPNNPQKWFDDWREYIGAVKSIRPDCKIAAIIEWFVPSGAVYSWGANFKLVDQCTAIFKRDINPLLTAICTECYYIDWPAPPSTGNGDTFNLWGMQEQPGWGFIERAHAQHCWIRGVSGKPAVHMLNLHEVYRPETVGKFLNDYRMTTCLNVIAEYEPAAVCLWGDAPNEHGVKFDDGYQVGTFDPKADWVAAVKKRTATK